MFHLIQNLSPTETIQVENNNQITYIPGKAFIGSNQFESGVKHIYLSNNNISQINPNAFKYLPNLTHLTLDHNNLVGDGIQDDGFKFYEGQVNRHIIVSLANNKLNSNSFTNETIVLPPKVTISLHLENNLFSDLPKEKFYQIAIKDGNKLFFDGNNFYCDCSMKWIIEWPQSNNIFNVFCVNTKKSIFDMNQSDFAC